MSKKRKDLDQPAFDYNKAIIESTAYLNNIGLGNQVKTFVEFWEGKQWPAPTDATRSLPRPVINFVKMIGANKISGILSSKVKLHYVADDKKANTTKFDRFASYMMKEIKQEAADSKALKDGAKKGTYVFHYYWDAEAKGMKGNTDGAIRVEVIEPTNVRFSNPNESDEQKQKWIIIISREKIDAIKELVKGNNKDMIASDANESFYQETEQEATDYVTVYTRYFRKDGEVYVEKATKSGVIDPAHPITPDYKKALEELTKQQASNEDEGETGLPDSSDKDVDDVQEANEEKMTAYPVVVESWDERDKSIYGIGEVESLMPNQKAVNFGYAMQLLKLQKEAWGKIIAKSDALNGQVVTNKPGQVITDYSKSAQGLYTLSEQALNANAINIIKNLMDDTRAVTGSTEVMTGEILGANMSGAAISALQAQASQPLKEKQQRFWRAKEKQGIILEQFYKFYYENTGFTYEEINDSNETEIKPDIFNGSEYINTNFRVVVEAGAASTYSESNDIAMLTFLLEKQMISVKTFIQAYPENALSNRSDILELINKEEKSQFAVISRQFEEAKMQLEQAAKVIQDQKQTIDKMPSIIRENSSLKQQLAALYQEASAKIQQGNAVNQEVTQDAMKFAQMLYEMSQQGQGTSPLTDPKAQPKPGGKA